MSEKFDFYYQWLGISPENQPPNHYRLLAVDLFEADPKIIRNAADRQIAYVKTFQIGPHSAESQQLLKEISAAQLCLLDSAKRAKYDAQLQAPLPTSLVPPIEISESTEDNRRRATASQGAASGSRQIPRSSSKSRGRNRTSNRIRIAGHVLAPLLGLSLGYFILCQFGKQYDFLGLLPKESVAKPTRIAGDPTNPSSAVAATQDEAADMAQTTGGIDNENAPPPPSPVIPTIEFNPPIAENPLPKMAPPLPTTISPAQSSPLTETVLKEVPLDSPPQQVEVANVPAAEPVTKPLEKLAVPDKADRDAKRRQVLSLFPIDKAQTSEAKGELAAQLIRTAKETTDDPSAVFAMLNLARELAAEAGHIKLAFEATDQLGETFEFDTMAVRIASLQQASRAALPPEAKREIVMVGIKAVDELTDSEKLDEAEAFTDRLLALSRPLRDTELIKSLAEKKRSIGELAVSRRKADAAFETLKITPNDSDANLVAGRYLTLIKQDWSAGLAHLSKGSDAALAAAASAELAAPESPADQELLGDLWWNAAAAQKETVLKDVCRAQAVAWYQEAVSELTGLRKIRVEKRIAEAGDVGASGRSFGARSRGKLEQVYLDDLPLFGVKLGLGSLGRHGRGFDGNPIVVQGSAVQHTLAMHPNPRSTAYVNYQLDGRGEMFEALVGMHGRSGVSSRNPVVMRVVGDDKVIWESPPLQRHDEFVPCRVKIQNIRVLSLQVHCPEDHAYAWTVWVNPSISRRVTAASSHVERVPIENGGTATDAPQIPADAQEFGGHCYLRVAELVSYADAYAACSKLGGHLVRIESEEELHFVRTLFSHVQDPETWIDGSDGKEEGRWIFSDGRQMTFAAWSPNEPNNWGGWENAVTMNRSGNYNDFAENRLWHYICEWDLPRKAPASSSSTAITSYQEGSDELDVSSPGMFQVIALSSKENQRVESYYNFLPDHTFQIDEKQAGSWKVVGKQIHLTFTDKREGKILLDKTSTSFKGQVSGADATRWNLQGTRLTVIAEWRHHVNGRFYGVIKLWSNGRINSPADHTAKWTMSGDSIALHWKNGWIDRCIISADGKRYEGKNQEGTIITGTKVD